MQSVRHRFNPSQPQPEQQITTQEFFKAIRDFNFANCSIATFNLNMCFDELLQLIRKEESLSVIPFRDGEVFHVFDDPTASELDYSKSSSFFCFHTDGQELARVPELALLYCVNEGSNNIPTVFADSTQILEIVKKAGLLGELLNFDFVYRNLDGQDYRRPVVETHTFTNELIMNVALGSRDCWLEPRQNCPATRIRGEELYQYISRIAEEDLDLVTHFWKRGDVVLFDNSKLIHGRGLPSQKNQNISDQKRHLCRMWIQSSPTRAIA